MLGEEAQEDAEESVLKCCRRFKKKGRRVNWNGLYSGQKKFQIRYRT